MKIDYYRLSTGVFDPQVHTGATLEVKTSGGPSGVTFEPMSGSPVTPMTAMGGGLFKIELNAQQLLKDFGPDDVHRNVFGRARVKNGAVEVAAYQLVCEVFDPAMAPAPVTKLSATAQYAERLVNIVSPAFYQKVSAEAATTQDVLDATRDLCKLFYQSFGDDYDVLSLIYEFPHPDNRRSRRSRNDVEGIGEQIFDKTAEVGSAGRLRQRIIFPVPDFFDGGHDDFSHEMGHLAINDLDLPALASPSSHWPLSSLASDLMGTSGGNFRFVLKPQAGGFDLAPDPDPVKFSDLSLYLLGFLPPDQVKDHLVFKDQSKFPGVGFHPSSSFTKVTIADVIASAGPRKPAAAEAQHAFRCATILITRDALASDRAMRFYSHFAARAEASQAQAFSQGLAKGTSLPFRLATGGLGRLNVRIKLRVLVDASRDGGVWWFPQAAGFDAAKPHQGKALADHLRGLGHTVQELPRGAAVTADLLGKHDVVIRAAGKGAYSAAEVAAYQAWVAAGGGLLLLAEFGPADDVATAFGLAFQGLSRGDPKLANFKPHPVTAGVGPLTYGVGAGLTQVPAGAEALGSLSAGAFLDLDGDAVKDPGEPVAPIVLGALRKGEGRVVFCGDANLWQTVPQPLVLNTLRWLTS